METIFSLTYSQNGNDAADGPSIGDFYSKATAQKVCPSDCVVTPRMVSAEYAALNCEDA